MAFAEHLKSLREKARMTQATVSAATGLSLGVVRDYEQGRKEPSFRSAVKLAAALGVSLEDLATGLHAKGNQNKPVQSPRGRPRRKTIPSALTAAESDAPSKKPRSQGRGK